MAAWLVLEDEPDVYEMMMAITDLLGIEGIAFVDGEEAIAWIEDVDGGVYAGSLPEVAVLDIRMPGAHDGVAVAERLRQSPFLRHIPIVLMTAYYLSPEQESDHMQRSQANRLLYKPLPKTGQLKALIDDLVAESRA
jgi:CheY-like chemotaxis protein